jgi:hypothetical protein
MLKMLSDLLFPTVVGTDPVNEFDFKTRKDSSDRLPIKLGNEPVR